MFYKEALWIRDRLLPRVENNAGSCRLLNVGSATKNYRKKFQGHVDELLFRPLEQLKVAVDHLDIEKDEGVDITGDLSDKTFLDSIPKKKYDIALCNNLLQHITNPDEVCLYIESWVKDGGFLIISMPHSYPYHNHPIDNMLRPDVQELSAKFPDCELVDGEVVQMDDNHFKMLVRNPKLLLVTALRIVTPFYKFSNWKKITRGMPRLFQPFSVTCVLLRR